MERRYLLQLVVESQTFYGILQHFTTPSDSFETSKTLAAQFLVNSRSQILQDSIRNNQFLRYLVARQIGLERRCLLQLVVESTTFYWILQHFTTPSDFVRTSKTIGAQFLVNSRSQMLQDSIRNYKLLRYLIARQVGLERRYLLQLVVKSTTFYGILQHFTTSSKFFETSKTVAAQFLVNSHSQMLQDSTRNYQLLRSRVEIFRPSSQCKPRHSRESISSGVSRS